MNRNTKAIVAGADLTAVSSNVVHHAVAIAQHFSAPCLIAHVMPDDFFARYRGQAQSLYETLQRQAEEKLQSLLPEGDHVEGIECRVTRGKPVEQINALVKECDASMLVIAANDLTKKRLGSIASRLVRTAPSDVLVLRDWQGGRFKKIMVCVDYSEMSSKALVRAAELAQSYEADLEIIHVMFPPSEDYWGKVQSSDDANTAEFVRQAREGAEKQMKKFLGECAVSLSGINHRYEILESRFPSVAITQRAVVGAVDLVVLGTHGMSGFVSNFIGSNAEKLINDCPVSVLAVRD